MQSLFDKSCVDIENEYQSLGHKIGWRFLTGPKATLSLTTEIAFISLNPGGKDDPPDHPHESSEPGNAYLIESWKDKRGKIYPHGKAPLQYQVQELFKILKSKGKYNGKLDDFVNKKILTAHFIPFRSRDFENLHNKKASIKFSKMLWTRILDSWLPQIIITIGEESYQQLCSILNAKPGSELTEHRYFQSGWGVVKLEAARYNISSMSKTVTIARFPHLSRFKLFSGDKYIIEKRKKHIEETINYIMKK